MRALALPALGFVLAGCTAGPAYRPPTPPVSASWQVVVPHDGSASAMADWWCRFDDLVLGRLIVQAGTDGPSLDKARAKSEKARATLTATRAAGLPSLNGGGLPSRGKQQTTGRDMPELATGRGADLDTSWELGLFSKMRRNAQAAQPRIDARISLAAEVADAHVQTAPAEDRSGPMDQPGQPNPKHGHGRPRSIQKRRLSRSLQ